MDCGDVCKMARDMGLSPNVRFVVCRACVSGCATACVCALGVLLSARVEMQKRGGAVAVPAKKRVIAYG